MFLVDADNPGWLVGDRMRTIYATTGGIGRAIAERLPLCGYRLTLVPR